LAFPLGSFGFLLRVFYFIPTHCPHGWMNRLLVLPVIIIFLFGTSFCASQKEYKKWKPLAEQGSANAQYNLGVMYYKGSGVDQDYYAAVRWYKLAAEQGNASAQNKLGGMYYKGRGVTQDYDAATRWYELAAEQGHASAQKNLGRLYAKGRGVTQNHKTALNWFRLSAEQGHAPAQNDLGVVLPWAWCH